ncbi:hypothetical protein BDV93DRAFT_541423 [Ceratobasidium sp. AG-I]|nr:hypothetical protein BDV93DRAFT_541423 [Ceratobasidium sp. AG-I]
MLIGSSRHSVDLRSSGVYSTANFFTPISQFRDLRFLRSSSAVVNARVLQLLGNLPRLESLAACSPCVDGDDDKDDLILIANLVLPERSFPSLRGLEIDCVPGTVLSKLWQTSPLVRNLVSVRVQFMAHNTESPSDLVCMICQGSPHITDLDLDLNRVGDTALSNVAVEHLRRLPLLRLRIWEAQVDVRSLVLALPNVEYLTLNSMLVNFEDLALIAKHMPKLQYLCTGLALWGWPMYFELPGDSWSPSPCHLDSRFPFEEFFNIHSPDYNEEIDEIAQGLHMLWPKGIHCGFGFWDDQGDTDYGTLERINNTTKALSASSALHIPTPEEASSRWVYESW